MQFPNTRKNPTWRLLVWGPELLNAMSPSPKIENLSVVISQCDLHTTTNILAIPELAAKCSQPFTPAEIDPKTGEVLKRASAMLYQ